MIPLTLDSDRFSPFQMALPYVLLNALALALIVGVAVALCFRRPNPRPSALVTILLSLAAGVGVFLLVSPRDIPIDWISVLQEGRSYQQIRALYDGSAHAGVNFTAILTLLHEGHGPELRDVVRLNLALASANLVLFAFLAWSVLGFRLRTLLMIVFFGGNGANIQSALSGVPAQLLGFYFLLGAVVVSATGRIRGSSRIGWSLVGVLSLLGILAALTRAELAAVWLPATLFLIHQLVGGFRVVGWSREFAQKVVARWRAQPPGTRRWSLVLVVVLALVWPLFIPNAGWVFDVLHPFNLVRVLSVPDYLARWLSWILVVLFLLGLHRTIRYSAAFLAVPFTYLYLATLYLKVSNIHFYEVFRYMTYIQVITFAIALHGWHDLDGIFRRLKAGRYAKHLATLSVALLWLVPSAGQVALFRLERSPDSYEPCVTGVLRQVASRTPWFRPPVQGDLQVAMRYLLSSTDEFPDCLFVEKSREAATESSHDDRWIFRIFGRKLPGPLEETDPGLTAEQVVEKHFPDERCAFYYRGLDCNLGPSNPCTEDLQTRRKIRGVTVPATRYNDPLEYGYFNPLLTLGLYEIRGRTPAGLPGD